ncbi:unnamed protein product [Symbiodinium sp. CCMP2456]|nr:unnamed protein product [Symbiodinium sp. CCMP2456]
MLNSHLSWNSGQPFPLEEHPPCYCIVTDDQVCNFLLYPERSVHYRQDLAALLRYDTSDVVITPSDPKQTDAACFGRSSRAVVAVGKARLGNGRSPVVCLLDCRPLLWGWRRVSAEDGWLDLTRLRRGFASVLPSGWSIHVGAHGEHRNWARVWSGQVLVLRLVPSTLPTGVPVYGARAPAFGSDDRAGGPRTNSTAVYDSVLSDGARGTFGTRNCEGPAPNASGTPDTSSGHDVVGHDTRGVQLPAALCTCPSRDAVFGAAHLCFGAVASLDWLWVYCLLLSSLGLAVRQGGLVGSWFLVGLGASALGHGRHIGRHRFAVLLLLCLINLGTLAEAVTSDPVCHTGPIFVPCHVSDRPLPTPCRTTIPQPIFYDLTSEASYSDDFGIPEEVDVDLFFEPLQTLLEESVARSDEWAFLAATLVETLTEHFRPVVGGPPTGNAAFGAACDANAALVSAPGVPPSCQVTPITLCEAIPATSFQQAALDLCAIVPRPAPDASGLDWLDADLTSLLAEVRHASRWHKLFSDIRSWHSAGAPSDILRLEIFTDGSADNGHPVPLLGPAAEPTHGKPCAWAFSVWVITVAGKFLLGCAAYTAVPPDTPFFVGEVGHRHISAHTGILENELVDKLAKLARAHRMQNITPGNVASYNVLTLFDPDATKGRAARNSHAGLMICGKRDLLKRQLLQANVWLLGLQETRLPETGVLPDRDFHMISSAATPEGSYGCSLWIRLDQPFARAQGKPCKVTTDQIVVSSFSPRHLQVQICTPWIQLTVLVAHGPSAVRHEVQADTFWRDRRDDLARRPEGSEIILLVDANSRLGSVSTSAVGPHHPEPESVAGGFFHGFLLDVGCALPSTFSHVHIGQSWTWAAPGDDPTRHRLDYIGVPDNWMSFQQCSHVWLDFEALQARLDHLPVVLEVTFWKELGQGSYVKAKRIAHRPSVGLSAVQRSAFAVALQSAPRTGWHADVDSHFAELVPALRTASNEIMVDSEAVPQQPYLTSDTLELVQERQCLRQYIRIENSERDRRLLLISFAAMLHHGRGTTFTAHALSLAAQWLAQIDVSIARAVSLLLKRTPQIRRAVKLDRAAYLNGLVQNLSLKEVLEPKRLYEAVRKAFPQARSARRAVLRPIPAVRLDTGELATSSEARNERWRAFFAEQEAGEVLTEAEYSAFFSSPDIPVQQGYTAFSVIALPTLGEIETAILSLKFGKASGPDGVTAEVLRAAPQATALFAYPLFLKAALSAREPIEWRGGNLIALAKKASKALECSGYRSILLASVVGKIHHKVIRGKLEPRLQHFKSGLQAGTAKGIGVDTVALAVKAFRGWTRRHSTSAAVTFYDIKAAYYHVLRQTLVQSPDQDGPLLQLLHRIGIPPAAVSELQGHLARIALLGEAGVDEHVATIVADLFRGTWFRLESSEVLTGTRRGTRPGDPLADLLFGFSFAGYLDSVNIALEAAGLSTPVPPTHFKPPWVGWTAPAHVNHASWADDYVHLQASADSQSLSRHIVLAARLHVEKASAVGMCLTFAPDKSAVLLSSRYSRSESHDISHDGDGNPGFDIYDSVKGVTHFLPIVDSYRHLGGILTANHSPATDLAYRSAQAWATLRPLRRRLFGSQGVPLTLRCTLLRSLVISKFTFACATVDLHAALHRRAWCKEYVNFWRTLCKRRYGEKPTHCYEVLRHSGAAPPLLALAQARAAFVERLLRFGPNTLLHLLHVHWRENAQTSWIQQLLLDLKAVAVYSTSAGAVLSASNPVLSLFEALQQEPRWWRRQIKDAIKSFHADLQAWANRAVGTAGEASEHDGIEVADTVELPFQCRWCGQTFRLHKHVAVHEARRHGALSPARHFAYGPWCIACLGFYHTTERVQNHLRQNHACLRRCAHLVPPLAVADVRELEQESKARKMRIRKGAWQLFTAATPACAAQGPQQPTADEALAGLEESEITIARLSKLYRPTAAVADWVEGTCTRRTPEGPRAETVDFWLRRPVEDPCFVSPRI